MWIPLDMREQALKLNVSFMSHGSASQCSRLHPFEEVKGRVPGHVGVDGGTAVEEHCDAHYGGGDE